MKRTAFKLWIGGAVSKRVHRAAKRVAGLFAAVFVAGLVPVPSALAALGFGPPASFPVGSSPSSVAVGDLNGDTKLDLAVANASSGNVSVLLGTGAGSFYPAADVGPDFTNTPNTLDKKHGYVFEVPAGGVSNKLPLTSMGRFAHEAAVPEPNGKYVYLTEDNFGFPSGFYRYVVPNKPKRDGFIANGGELQMLAVVGQPGAELDLQQTPGTRYEVTWVDIPNPDPDMTGMTNNQAIVAVGDQGRARGAALFSRLEGATYADGRIYFTSTQGGEADTILGTNGTYEPVNDGYGRGRGQVWAYQPGPERLTCVYQSPGSSTLDLPDNVAASAGGALVLCEDGSGDNFLRGLRGRVSCSRSPATPMRRRSGRSSPGPGSAPTCRPCS